MPPLLPFARKGVPAPYLIAPCTVEEASTGKATLISAGDLAVIIKCINKGAPERKDLLKKFRDLKA